MPRLEEIEKQLRGTVGRIMAQALRRGEDPAPAIARLRAENLTLQQERSALLKEHGYPADALEERPRCILCGDTGYCRGSVCACLQNYYAREQIRQLSSMLDVSTQSFDTFELDWYDTEPGAFSRSPRETMERNFTVCRRFAQDFGHSGGNLLLSATRAWARPSYPPASPGWSARTDFPWCDDTAGHVFARCEAAKFRSDEEPDAAEDVRRYEKSDLLILDDLGTEMTTAFVQSALYQLVNSRLLAGKSTVINTNLTPPELGVRYGAAVRSRLEGEYTVLPFIGRDIRKLKRERS
ncbi:MAG: DNA replication protein DnaC [Oscillospiraceae bacterium]